MADIFESFDATRLSTALESFARSPRAAGERSAMANAARLLRVQSFQILSLKSELDYWKTQHIRSGPMDPKVVDHLPVVR